MTPTESDPTVSEFERRSRELLLASTAAVDARAQSRLTQARHAALAEFAARPGTRLFRVPGVWLPAGAVSAAALLALAVWLAQPGAGPTAAGLESSPVEDVEILASNDGPDLVADDADFYEWAGTDAAAGAAGNAG